jgi:hypothetical protein
MFPDTSKCQVQGMGVHRNFSRVGQKKLLEDMNIFKEKTIPASKTKSSGGKDPWFKRRELIRTVEFLV